MGTSITLTDIEKFEYSEVVDALEFIAKKANVSIAIKTDTGMPLFDQNKRFIDCAEMANMALSDSLGERQIATMLPDVIRNGAQGVTVVRTTQSHQAVTANTATLPPVAELATALCDATTDLVNHQASITGVDVDTAGLPWDGRIHASTRTKTQDGCWKAKRNVPDDVVEAVVSELRQTMSAGKTVEQADPAQVFAPPVVQSAPAVQSAPVIQPPPFAPVAVAPVPTPVNTSTLPTPQTGIATGASPSEQNLFIALMKQITLGHANKTLTQEAITSAVQSVGLPSLPMLNSRPDLVPTVAAALGLTL